MVTVRLAILVAVTLALSLSTVAGPGHAAGPGAAPAPASSDLGAVYAEGVTVTDAIGTFDQANAYTFQVTDGPGSVHVYVGDLWYDVEVLLWRASSLPGDPAQMRWAGCDRGAGCIAAAPPSGRRRIQLIQPKVLLEAVEPGGYALVVRPRDQGSFEPWRQFTLRVAATPPICSVARDGESGYLVALAVTPARPRRADMVTLNAYVLPPFGDLFDYEWSVDGRRLDAAGPTAQAVAFDLQGGRSGANEIQVVARGARPYPDPEQPQIPPSLTVGCPLTIG